jgi:hypothetical protein
MNVAKKAVHFLTLAFTAFWLVATSQPRKPARDCFVLVPSPAVTVTLGPALSKATDSGLPPSCLMLDGLREGSVLRALLERSSDAPQVSHNDTETCWGYGIKALSGPKILSQLQSAAIATGQPRALFDVEAAFSSAERPKECFGEYRLSLAAAGPIRQGHVINPLHAGIHQAWRVRRLIRFGAEHTCKLLPELRDGYCEDTFEVRSIAPAP